MGDERERLQVASAELAKQGVYIGTSSWKYPGWRGMLYQEDRYIYRENSPNRDLIDCA